MKKGRLKINKKAEMSQLIKFILWIIFFLIALFGIYFLLNRLTS